ncbi:MAG: hypothetical protein GY898_04510 [Proteobacteria bacterium]|nr:hypothetical protein [Pseudomonadota bacterium]
MLLRNTLAGLALPALLLGTALAHEVEEEEAEHAHVRVEVTGTDESLRVTANGADFDPSGAVAVPVDVYEFAIDAPCWEAEPKRVALLVGRDEIVTLKARPKMHSITVKARGPAGELSGARVLVDGEEVGHTPLTLDVSVCAKKLEVSAHSLTAWSAPLSSGLKEVTANLSTSRRDRNGIPIVGTGGGSLFAKALKIKYPKGAQKARIDGVVRIRILIDERGKPIKRTDDRCKPIYEAEGGGLKTWHNKSCAYGEGPAQLVEGALRDWLKAGFRPYFDPEDEVASPAWITGKTTYKL